MRIVCALLILCCLCLQYASEHIWYSSEATEWADNEQDADEEESKEDNYKQKNKTEEDKVHQINKCTLPALLYCQLGAKEGVLRHYKYDIFGVTEYDGELNSPPPELYV